MHEVTPFQFSKYPNDSWTRVELFLRANGRLPETLEDKITQDTLDLFCKKFENNEIKSPTVDLHRLYLEVKSGGVRVDN